MNMFRSQPLPGSGGSVQFINGYAVHTFTAVGTSSFTTNSQITNCQILVVGGGGGGGQSVNEGAAGGGAGGLVYCASLNIPVGSYSVTVGNGGTIGAIGADNQGGNGGNSTFSGGSFSFTANGGGGGGAHDLSGSAGGSGGGAGGTNVTTNPGATNQTTSFTGGVGYGNAGGGNFTGSPYAGGGGGGAGAAGSPSTSSGGGAGGIGKQYSISGTPKYYAGGGGGGSPSAAGGTGGGGAGGGTNGSGLNATPGTNGLGGGGGGAGYNNTSAAIGGTGIVIIAYPYAIISVFSSGKAVAVPDYISSNIVGSPITISSLSPYPASCSLSIVGSNTTYLNWSALSLPTNLGNTFTLETWAYYNNFTNASYLFGGKGPIPALFCDSSTSSVGSFYFGATVSGNVGIYYWDGGGDVFATSSSTISASTWNHLTLTFNGSIYRIFINGVLSATNTKSGNGMKMPGLHIGSWFSSSQNARANVNALIASSRFVLDAVVYPTSSTTIGTSVFTPPSSPVGSYNGVGNPPSSTPLLINIPSPGVVFYQSTV